LNLQDLTKLIADGESERLEFKRSTGQRSRAAKTVCAMLNGLGGFLLFGVTNSGELVGQEISSKTLDPIIANVFYRAGIIERWGMGTLNIIDWCTENGNPPPSWQEQAGSVYVTFLPAELPATRQVPDKYPASDPTRGGCVGGSQKPRDQNRTATKRGASGPRALCQHLPKSTT